MQVYSPDSQISSVDSQVYNLGTEQTVSVIRFSQKITNNRSSNAKYRSMNSDATGMLVNVFL